MVKKTGLSAAAIMLTLMLIFAMFAGVGCDDGGGSSSGNANTEDLEAAIAAANNEKEGVLTASSASEVPLGTYWVTPGQMSSFTAAIASAEAVKNTAKTQSAVNGATETLKDATERFKGQKSPGAMQAANKSALISAISEADTAKLNVVVALSASEVASGLYFVNQSVMTNFDNAISAAKLVRDNPTATQQMVNSAADTLSNATYTFYSARSSGNKTSGFNQSELTALITMAKDSKAGVVTSTTGNDVSPASFWVTSTNLAQFDTAITDAENASENIDAAYNTLVAAMNIFNNNSKSLGTSTEYEKYNLYYLINQVNGLKSDVETAASKSEASQGSQWATAAQWVPLNSAYDAAITVYNNPNATFNNVTAQYTALQNAINTFEAAVDNNGPGERSGSTLTITGLNEYNGFEISVGLFTSMDDIGTNSGMVAFGYTYIENGTAVINLINYSNGTPWAGTGSRFVGFSIYNGETMISRVSTNAVNFSANPNPTVPFSGFKKHAFTTTWGEILDIDFPSGGITLDALAQQEYGMTYAQYLTNVVGSYYVLYKNSAMTQQFTGTDRVTADTVIYSEIQLVDNRGEKIGEISGTITLTDITNPAPRVSIYAQDYYYGNWYLSRSRITGITGTTATVNFSIPIYENDDFYPSSEVRFRLYVKPQGMNEFYVEIQGSKAVSDINSNVGNLGSVSIKYITVSGTINVSLEGTPVPQVRIYAHGDSDWYSTTLYSPAANAAWSIAMPVQSRSSELYLEIEGRNTNRDRIFSREHNPSRSIYNTDVSGININLGSITNPNKPSNVTALTADTWVDASISQSEEIDWYSFNVTSGTRYNLWWNDNYSGDGSKSVDIDVYAFSGDVNNLTSVSLSGSNDSAWNSPSYFTASFTGTVYVRVRAYSGNNYTGTYAIAYNTGSSAVRPGFVWPPLNVTTPALTQNIWANGNISSSGGEQWFSFTATSSTQFIHFSSGTLYDVYVEVYNNSGNRINSTNGNQKVNLYSSNPYGAFSLTANETYYIKVTPYNSDYYGNYQIAFNTSSNSPAQPGAKTITITGLPSSYGEIQVGLFNTATEINPNGNGAVAYANNYFDSNSITLPLYNTNGSSWTGTGNYFVGVSVYDYNIGSTTLRVSSSAVSFTSDNTSVQYSSLAEYVWTPPSDVTALTQNTWTSGTITSTAAERWYSFSASQGTRYYVHVIDSDVQPGSGRVDARVDIYNSSGTTITSGDIQGYRDFTANTSGTVYIKIAPLSSGSSGSFEIAFNTSSNSPALPGAKTITITGLPSSYGEIQVGLFNTATEINPNGNGAVAYANNYFDSNSITLPLYNTNGSSWTGTGNYFVGVSIYNYNTGSTTLRVSSSAVSFTSDNTTIQYSSLTEYVWTPPSDVTALTQNTWTTGSLQNNSSDVWYSFNASSGYNYIYVDDSDNTSGYADVRVGVYNSSGELLNSGDVNTLNINNNSSGTVYVRIYPYSSTSSLGNFRITYNTTGNRPN